MTNPRSGLSAQVGWSAEDTWGVPKTVTTFQRLVSESMTREDERIESAGIIAGRRVLTSDEWVAGKRKVGGSLGFELTTKDLAVLWQHAMGDASSPYTPGDLTGLGLTFQIGKPDVSGTVQPFTYAGCKIAKWELAGKVGEIATFGVDLVAKREILVRTVADGATNTNTTVTSATAAFTDDDIGKPISGTNIPAGTTITAVASATSVTISQAATGTGTGITLTIGVALASASYTSGVKPVSFVQGSVTVAGSAVKIKSFKLAGDNGLDAERYFFGQADIDEPLETKLREYTGELEVEFTDLTQYRRYLNASELACVLTFSASGGFSQVITTNVRLDGNTPTVGGTEIVPQTIPFKCIASGADSTAISIALTEAS